MEWVETTGRSVAEALEAALDELGVDERDAEVVVVEEPRNGLFGLGRSPARIRARVRPTAPRPKRPQRGRRREQRSGGGRKQDRSGQGRPAVPPTPPIEQAAVGADGGEPGNGNVPAPPRRRRSGSRPAAQSGPRDEAAAGAAREREDGMSIEQQAEVVRQFVDGVVERFGFTSATTAVRVEEEHIFLEVTGDELGLLVGPRGRTLDALQELARTVLQRRGEEPGARVVVDVAGFRAKRAAALAAFVQRLAAEVIEAGEPRALEPMSAADRKVVHDTASAIPGLESTSEGVDPNRYVVLRPSGSAASTPPAGGEGAGLD